MYSNPFLNWLWDLGDMIENLGTSFKNFAAAHGKPSKLFSES